ncbi:nonstructural protein [Blackfly microvirus SF02]|uniref:Nonstructural protein n=1 Tax=Blackfly microvirus SF02 TaxID=2576452 RepID=A0A4P8PU16_9VIRU|nr:nonstructural protein [Blackfly microvirus SF02]
MIWKIFAVRDEAVEAYTTPIAVRSTGEAIRAFQDTVNKPETPFNNHPADYSLWFLGNWDDNSGAYDMEAGGPSRTMRAVDAIEQPRLGASF